MSFFAVRSLVSNIIKSGACSEYGCPGGISPHENACALRPRISEYGRICPNMAEYGCGLCLNMASFGGMRAPFFQAWGGPESKKRWRRDLQIVGRGTILRKTFVTAMDEITHHVPLTVANKALAQGVAHTAFGQRNAKWFKHVTSGHVNDLCH